MDIDWSKAPKWARELAINPYNQKAWLGDEGYSYLVGNVAVVPWSNEIALARSVFKSIDVRPAPWTSEVPPPVGTVCEVRNSGLHNPVWEKCTILFRGKHRILYDSESCCERVAFIQDLEFRQIRTPEQIAAEEREHELNRMVATVSMLDKGWARKVCAGLYDAGYRKFEIVDE